MTDADLPRLVAWFREPPAFRWWCAKYLPGLDGRELVHMSIVSERAQSIGFAQWYAWSAGDDELGIDYTIGEPAAVDRGAGTALIARR